MALSALLAAPTLAQTAEAPAPAAADTVKVALDTSAGRIVLALDVKQDADGAWRMPVAGWTANSTATLQGLLDHYVPLGLHHLLCTDISRDGMLSGFNLDLYRWIAGRWPALSVQASGGVRDLDDVRAAREAGATVAILGRALLERRLDLRAAIAGARAPC